MQPVAIMAKTMANFFKWMIIKGSLDKEMSKLFDENIGRAYIEF